MKSPKKGWWSQSKLFSMFSFPTKISKQHLPDLDLSWNVPNGVGASQPNYFSEFFRLPKNWFFFYQIWKCHEILGIYTNRGRGKEGMRRGEGVSCSRHTVTDRDTGILEKFLCSKCEAKFNVRSGEMLFWTHRHKNTQFYHGKIMAFLSIYVKTRCVISIILLAEIGENCM